MKTNESEFLGHGLYKICIEASCGIFGLVDLDVTFAPERNRHGLIINVKTVTHARLGTDLTSIADDCGHMSIEKAIRDISEAEYRESLEIGAEMRRAS